MWPLAQLVGAKKAELPCKNMASKVASFSTYVFLVYILMRGDAVIK